MNTHSKDAHELLRVLAESMPRGTSNDYFLGGEPWVIFAPEHAEILKAAGLCKADVKRLLWEGSKMPASRMAEIDIQRTGVKRKAALGDISRDTLLPICASPEALGIVVCGGPGTHSVYVPSEGNSFSITREVICLA